MNFLRTIKIDGFNTKTLTEQDGFNFCEENSIVVQEADVASSFYFYCYGRHFIVLKKGLRGLKKTFSLFHEIAHFLRSGGHPASPKAYFYGLVESRDEIEADAFATVAIVPITALDNYDFLENHPRSRFARNLFKERQRLAFLYRV